MVHDTFFSTTISTFFIMTAPLSYTIDLSNFACVLMIAILGSLIVKTKRPSAFLSKPWPLDFV
jgi:hypothetical protein